MTTTRALQSRTSRHRLWLLRWRGRFSRSPSQSWIVNAIILPEVPYTTVYSPLRWYANPVAALHKHSTFSHNNAWSVNECRGICNFHHEGDFIQSQSTLNDSSWE
jgi:hypothetical protein